MSMVHVLAVITAKPGKRAEVLAILMRMCPRCMLRWDVLSMVL